MQLEQDFAGGIEKDAARKGEQLWRRQWVRRDIDGVATLNARRARRYEQFSRGVELQLREGFDVLQCRTQDANGTWSADTCPNSGGLDQDIYGAATTG